MLLEWLLASVYLSIAGNVICLTITRRSNAQACLGDNEWANEDTHLSESWLSANYMI